MSWLSQLFNPGGGYDKAKEDVNAGYNHGQQMRQPYVQAGNGALEQLQQMLSNLGDPAKLQDEWSSHYSESPYAKQLEEQAKSRALDSASSQGLLGSTSAANNIGTSTTNIMNADRKDYMDSLMQKYLTGLGLGENITSTGASMASQGANSQEKQGETTAGLDFGKYNAGPDMLTGGANGIMQMLTQYLTGGFGTGGMGRGMWAPTPANPGVK